MKTNKGIAPIAIILIIIAFLAVGSGAYYVGKKSNNVPVPEKKSNPMVQPKPQTNPEPAFLEEFIKNGDSVKECVLDTKKVFTVDSRTRDGGLAVYNNEGSMLFECGSGYGGFVTSSTPDQIKQCMQIDQNLKNCKTIFNRYIQ